MNIGVIGAGNVGGTLGRRWAQGGHTVKFGVRDVSEPKYVALADEAGPNASLGTVAEAAAFGEVVVLTTPWEAAKAALEEAGDLSGKILLDTTNPLKADMSGLVVGLNSSAGEQIAEWAKGAHVVKIFNTTGAGNMANPRYGDVGISMLYCGDDANAKATAAQLASELGFSPVDAGPLTQARVLEPLAMLWISLAFGGQGFDFAFQLLHR